MLNKCPDRPDMTDWSDNAEKQLDAWLGFRENKAAELLFSECLKKFESASRRAAVFNMFGGNVKIISAPSKPKATTAVTATPTPKNTPTMTQTPKPSNQKTISSFLLDSYIVDNMKKKERAAATAAKKKLKEQAQDEE
jgi:hypothetical protein